MSKERICSLLEQILIASSREQIFSCKSSPYFGSDSKENFSRQLLGVPKNKSVLATPLYKTINFASFNAHYMDISMLITSCVYKLNNIVRNYLKIVILENECRHC